MRTITTNLYQFSELSEAAKRAAVNNLRSEAAESAAEADWNDATSTIKFVEKVANIYADITSSSQGFYVRHCFSRTEEYELTDKEEFEAFRKRFFDEYTERMWCDKSMYDIVMRWQFDERRGYASNVAWMIVSFCEDIERLTLNYYDDDCVKEWICMNDFEFTEDGRAYFG